jgi:hypothetical protein
MNYIFANYLFLITIFIAGCGSHVEPENDAYKKLTQEEKDYIERFNVVAKDIRDFPPKGKNIEKYFHIFKNVSKLEDAKIIFFGEDHTNASNQLWSAGAINKLIKSGDVVLFEGAQAGTQRDIPEEITTGIFAAREYEKLKSHKTYKPTANSKIQIKYLSLFYKTRSFLAINELNLEKGKGFYWDLIEGDDLHPDSAKRNEEMVQTIKNNLIGDGRVFVIAGARHLPHYEFASTMKFEEELDAKFPLSPSMPAFLASPGAKRDEINLAYYNYWGTLPNTRYGKTRVIFEFLKDKDFVVLIPKNLPNFKSLESFFPKNVL